MHDSSGVGSGVGVGVGFGGLGVLVDAGVGCGVGTGVGDVVGGGGVGAGVGAGVGSAGCCAGTGVAPGTVGAVAVAPGAAGAPGSAGLSGAPVALTPPPEAGVEPGAGDSLDDPVLGGAIALAPATSPDAAGDESIVAGTGAPGGMSLSICRPDPVGTSVAPSESATTTVMISPQAIPTMVRRSRRLSRAVPRDSARCSAIGCLIGLLPGPGGRDHTVPLEDSRAPRMGCSGVTIGGVL